MASFPLALRRAVASVILVGLVGGSAIALSTAAMADEVTPSPEVEETALSVPEQPMASSSPVASDVPFSEPPAVDVAPLTPVATLFPAADLLVDITSPPTGTVSFNSTFVVSGTVDTNLQQVVGVTATTTDFGIIGACSDLVLVAESTWSCELNLEYTGDLTLTATTIDFLLPEGAPGPESAPVDVRIDPMLEALFGDGYAGFSNEFLEQAISLSGTGPANGSVRVEAEYYPDAGEGGSQIVEACTASVDSTGQWSCTTSPLANGGFGYYGYVYFSAIARDFFLVEQSPFSDQIGGDFIRPALGVPVLQYVLSPSTIAVTATGAEGAVQVVELWTAQSNGEGYSFTFVESCEGSDPVVGPPPASRLDCRFDNLAPGIWNIYFQQVFGESGGDWTDDFVRIPEPPVFFSPTVNADRRVTFAGTGTPGYRVQVVRGASDVCDVPVAVGGTWTCTATLPAGTATVRSVQESVGFEASPGFEFGSSFNGFSSLSAARSVTVPSAPVPPAPALEAPSFLAPQVPLTAGTVRLVGLPSTAVRGTELEVVGNTDCVAPIVCDVDVDIFSTPRRLGSTVTQSGGEFALVVTVPQDLEPGDHTLVVTVTPRGGVAAVVSQPITIGAVAELVDPGAKSAGASVGTVDKVDQQSTSDGNSAFRTADRDSFASPSVLTESLPSFKDVFRDPFVLAAGGGLAVAILLLVVIPTELLNSTLSSNTARFGRGFVAIESAVDRATHWFTGIARTTAIPALILVLLTSIIFGFVDPKFGLDAVSLRLVLSLAIGLFIVTYVASWISGSIIKRVWGISSTIALQPIGLLFAAIGVVVARLLDFSPGFLVGLVIGLQLLSKVGSVHRTRALVVQLGTVAVLAMLAWVGYVLVTEISSGLDFGTALLLDTLAATTVEGLTAVTVAILPLGFLEGREIYRKSKPLLLLLFFVFATSFALIILPTASGDAPLAQIAPWVLVLAVFAAVTLIIWAALHFTASKDDDADHEVDAADLARSTVGGARD